MSVLTKKQPVITVSGLRDQATSAARQAGPLAQQAAQQAMPFARNAGTTVRESTGTAVAWATPKVDAARSWAAPQLEQSARAISESIAPMISSALISAAQKIDAPKRKSRSARGSIVAGTVLLTAAAGAAGAAVYAMRHKQNGDSADAAMAAEPGPVAETSVDVTGVRSGYDYDESGAEPDVNGHPRIV